ncbi:transposase family protein [Streptomyces viridiviolaceus]|uniref:Transposase family protein n=1 Tax=Streptomyces viridiviolaceus TaxID=68282 RepID=A0ABW2EAX5_9ACTN
MVFADRLVATLIRLRHDWPHSVLGLLFGADRSTITRRMPPVQRTLGTRPPLALIRPHHCHLPRRCRQPGDRPHCGHLNRTPQTGLHDLPRHHAPTRQYASSPMPPSTRSTVPAV